jgi:YVTN family beta-propeller protein
MSPSRLGLLIVLALLVLSSTLGIPGTRTDRIATPPSTAVDAPSAAVLRSLTPPPAGTVAAAPAEIPVGGGPDALAVDPANGTLFVANEYTNNLSEISLATNTVLASITVGSQPAPGALAVDVANGTAYVANSGSNNVSAVSLSLGGVSASIPVGSVPDALLFNPANGYLYVANAGSGNVSIISTVTNRVVLSVPVGPNPVAMALDTANRDVVVAASGSNNVTIISGVSNAVLGTVIVGSSPEALAFDPANGMVYVANTGSANVSVVGVANHTLVATIPVGNGPNAVAVDTARSEVCVVNSFSNNLTILSTKTDLPVANLSLGSQPSSAHGIAFQASSGVLYVPNSGSGNVSVISVASASVAGTIPVLNIPEEVALNSSSGVAYVANFGSANVSVFSVSRVSFVEAGLPPATDWSVSAGTPAVNRTNETVKATGSIGFFEENGLLPFAVHPPASFGVARVSGRGVVSQTVANISGTSVTIHVLFGALEPVWFNESSTPAFRAYSGALWSVALTPAVPHGGPPGVAANTTASSVSFLLPAGANYRFGVTGPGAEYRALPGAGSFHVPSHPFSKTVRFLLLTVDVVFRESGLVSGSNWTVTIDNGTSPAVTYPFEKSAASGVAIVVRLPAGSYGFTVTTSGSGTPSPSSGTVSVPAPPSAAVMVTITFS